MEKIKPFINQCLESEKGKDILIVIIVILVGLGSFGLGRLSKSNQSPGIKIEYPKENLLQNGEQEANVIFSTENMSKAVFDTKITGKIFFASNRGKKYYSIGCSAGKTIKQENRIYFATREEAERAGYELSSSCQ